MKFNHFIFIFLIVLLSAFLIQDASGFSLPHFFKENTTCASTTTEAISLNVTDSTDFDFISGRKYLIIATATFGGTSSSTHFEIFLAHNQTKFDGGHKIIEPSNGIDVSCGSVNDDLNKYFFWTVWSPIGSEANEDIVIGVNATDTTPASEELHYDDVTIAIFEISEQLTENVDWFFNANTTDNTLSFNSFNSTNDASIQFTPENNNDDWLILGTNTIETDSAVVQYMTRLFVNGTETDLPVISQEGENVIEEKFVQTFARVLTLPNSTSQLIEVESQIDAVTAGNHTREYSAIFALNLDKFVDHSFVWSPAELDVTHVQIFNTLVDSISITPSTNNTDTFVLADIGVRDTEEQIHLRLQVDDIDEPTGQTAQELQFLDEWNVDDDLRWTIGTIENMTNSTHIIDVDGAEPSNSGAKVVYRTLVAFTLDLVDVIMNQVDSFSITDQNNHTAVLIHNQTDSMILNDTNTHLFTIIHNQTDNIIINDTNTHLFDITHNQTDSMIINDTNTHVSTIIHNQTDSMILNDANTHLFTIIHNQTDNMILNDTNSFFFNMVFNQTDSMILNDTNTYVATLIHNQTDSMILNDTNAHIATLIHNQTDSIILNDTNSHFFDIIHNQVDNINLIDIGTTHLFDIIHNQLDSFNFIDANSLFFEVPAPPAVGGGGGVGTVGGALPPTIPDSDGDGILDPEDACPLEPEDFDGFEDADGCPEDGFIQPPQPLSIPDIVDLIPFEFNELDVIDDYIELELGLPQPQVEDLGVRWLGAQQITITSIDIGLSPFEIQVQDIPVTFGNNRFGYTETQLLYTVQPPDKICGNIITTDCLDEVTYKIPVVVTGVINGKTVIADGSITIDNSSRVNPYWLAFFALILIPLLAILFWKRRTTKVTTKTILKVTQSAPTSPSTLTIITGKPLKAGTTRKKLKEGTKLKITINKKSLESKPPKFKSIKEKKRRKNIFGR